MRPLFTSTQKLSLAGSVQRTGSASGPVKRERSASILSPRYGTFIRQPTSGSRSRDAAYALRRAST